MENRNFLIKTAAMISLLGNAALATMKVLIGFSSGALSVVGDGIDSSTDVIISVITLITANVIARPSDKEHPYGHSRAETISTVLLAFVIFFAGAQLLLSTVHDISSGVSPEAPGTAALYVTAISIVGKLALAFSQFRLGRKTGSSMLLANAKNMRNDVIVSVAVLSGLAFTFLLGLPILDRVMAIAVSLWIFKTAVGIFLETNDELMDGIQDDSPYHELFAAVKSVPEAGNPHRVRIRKLSSYFIADLDIEVDGSMTVAKAHGVAQRVEREIKARFDNMYDVIVHVEPMGNDEDERFGLKEVDLAAEETAAKTE